MSGIAGRLFQRIFPLFVTEIPEFTSVTAIHNSIICVFNLVSMGGDRFIEKMNYETRDANIISERIFNCYFVYIVSNS